jgi:hypothetical protein
MISLPKRKIIIPQGITRHQLKSSQLQDQKKRLEYQVQILLSKILIHLQEVVKTTFTCSVCPIEAKRLLFFQSVEYTAISITANQR